MEYVMCKSVNSDNQGVIRDSEKMSHEERVALCEKYNTQEENAPQINFRYFLWDDDEVENS